MFVNGDMVREMAERFGSPVQTMFEVEVGTDEFDFIRSTQHHGRSHDATLYVMHEGNLVVNAKHFYPPGMFRAPSGGLNVGESFDDAIARELWEETGCRADIVGFLLTAHVRFVRGETGRLLSVKDVESDSPNLDPSVSDKSGHASVPRPSRWDLQTRTDPTASCGRPTNVIVWTSFVFQLNYIEGDFEFTDHREIREVTTVPLSAFDQIGRTMRASDKGGLHYRAALHERVTPLLQL